MIFFHVNAHDRLLATLWIGFLRSKMITSVQAADAALTLKPSYLESPRLRSYKNGKFPLEWAAGMADTMTDQMS